MSSLTLQICFLTGRYVATTYNDRELAEWPPHPARVYSALVATWADQEEPGTEERTALEWLAALDPPEVYASEAGARRVVPHFVPVNDTAVLRDFDQQARKLSVLELDLAEAKKNLERNEDSANRQGVSRATREVAKLVKARDKDRKKLVDARLLDQQPAKLSDAAIQSARHLLPEHRLKQQRFFPSVAPHDPTVCLTWKADQADVTLHGPVLDRVARAVVRLGHSSSLVACSVAPSAPSPTWEPADVGDEVLRVPSAGQLTRLEEAFALHGGVEPRVLPCRFQRYRRVGLGAALSPAHSTFDSDWILFRQRSGRRLSQTSCVELADALRSALLHHAEDPTSEILSGKSADAARSEAQHLAFIPLPYVGPRYATGEILGVALVPPKDISDAQRVEVLRAIGRWEDASRAAGDGEADTPPLALELEQAGRVMMERVEWGEPALVTLRAATWCKPSHAWSTVTPIALDQNPGDLRSRDRVTAEAAYVACQAIIIRACERIGLPKPSYVEVHPSVPIRGAAKARSYPNFPAESHRQRRVKVHARIEFPAPVCGPVILGAGRYLGLGLCLPLQDSTQVAS